MSAPSVTRIFSGNSSSLLTADKRFVLYMHIIRFTQFFQLTKNSKNFTFSVSPGCECKPSFPKAHCCWRTFQGTATCHEEATQYDIRQFLQCECATLCPGPQTLNTFTMDQCDQPMITDYTICSLFSVITLRHN